MKYTLGFLVAFLVFAGAGLALRVALTNDHEHVHPNAQHEHDEHADDHHDHDHGEAEPSDSEWGGPVRHDLKNTLDPVTQAEVGDDHAHHAHAVYHGYLIHFADEDTVRQFQRQPIRYLHRLELEPKPDGTVIKVDASQYVTAPMPEHCPFCHMEMVNVDDVYILHRNFKIHFG
jgi:YHS domain-containing protein